MMLLWTGSHAQEWVEKMNDPNATFKEVQTSFYKHWKNKPYKKGHGYKQFKRWEYLWGSRLDENGNLPPADFLSKEQQRYRASHPQLKNAAAGNWSLVHPTNTTELKGGIGRVNCVAAHPTNPNILWAGTPVGGLWKSTDGGQNWTTNTDNLPVLGVSGIAIAPNNTNVMYIATGDADGKNTYSVGILKSTDGGNTWNTTGLNQSTANRYSIFDIKIHPNNNQILIAATSIGIYRSTNGGTNWSKVYNTSYVFDIEFHPTTPSIIYASNSSSIYKSSDSGANWNQLSSGLPSNTGRIELAVTPAKPDYLYALYSYTSTGSAVYRSTNQGSSFVKQNLTTPNLGSQTGYDLCITASPTNAEEIFFGGVELFKSTDGGKSFQINGRHTNGQPAHLHLDHHNLHWVGNTLYSCNDGGLYKTTNSGNTWSLLGNGMDIMQFYRLSSYKYDANRLSGGSQDNGSSKLVNGIWSAIGGGDGMQTIISHENPNVIYYSSQKGGSLLRTQDGFIYPKNAKTNINETGAWITPYIMDHSNANILYAGFQNVWKTTNGGDSWTKISNFPSTDHPTELVQSKSSPQTLWCIRANKTYKTTDGGGNWVEITMPKPNLRGQLAIDPTNANRIWIGYENTVANNKVFKSEDGGTNWTNISGTLPNIPVNDIVYQEASNDALYIATDLGVYYRNASMNDWIPFNNGLPNVRVDELEINIRSGKILAATFGRSMWKSDLQAATNKPIADFNTDQTFGCKGMNVTFTNFSANATSYSWSFPGGTPSTSTEKNPTVTYANGGSYNVTLTATNANGTNTETKNNFINVSGGVISSFPYTENFDSFTKGTPGTLLNGWMNATDDHADWFVHSGPAPIRSLPGGSETGPSKDHTSGNGNYMLIEASQLANHSNATLLSPCLDLTGLTKPVLEYYEHIHGHTGYYTLGVDILVNGNWTNAVIPTITTPQGDKWIRKELDLTPYIGKTVQLRFVMKTQFSKVDWAIDDFKLWDNRIAAPKSQFTATPTTGQAGVKVKFSDNSAYAPTSWSWSFPGGTPSTSTVLNPEVTYNVSGEHTVTLTTTNAQGSHTETKNAFIKVTGGNLMSNNTVTACTGTLYDSGGPNSTHSANENFVFTIAPPNATSVTINTAQWHLGPDDEFIIYNGKNTSAPVIGTFKKDTNPGTKTANSGAMTFKFTSKPPAFYAGWKIDWTSTGGNCVTEKPIVAFTASTTNPFAGNSVQFTDQSTKAPTSWTWSFPGGTPNTSTVQNPSIVYNTPGTYNVTLTATNNAGNNVLTKTGYIIVKAKEVLYNMSNKTVTDCSGTLYDSGGTSANYKNDENYTFVINPANADKVTMNFTSWDVENSYDFLKIYNGTSASAPLIGSYSGTSPGTVVANSGAMTLVFTSDYTENKAGWVANWNCSQNTTPPVAAFTASSTTIEKGNTVTFTDTSTNKPTSRLWTFEGGTPATSTIQNPTVTYNTAGVYKVTLKVTNSFGSDDEVKETYITVKKPLTAYNMSSRTVTDCNGRLYDSGGKTGNYSDDENYTFVIQPSGASSITLTTHAWDVENSYDFLKIYNGTSAAAPLLGSYSGTSPGTVVANSGAVTLVFTSDYMENKPGFDITWKTFGSGCRFASEAPPTTHAHGTSNTTNKISNNDSSIKVYPIPVTSTISVSLKQKPTKEAHIVVVDNLGRAVKQLKTLEATTHIDASNLQAGIYLVKIIMNNETIVKRIIKK